MIEYGFDLDDVEWWGYYWTRTKLNGCDDDAYMLFSGYKEARLYGGEYRYRGATVRAVRVSQN